MYTPIRGSYARGNEDTENLSPMPLSKPCKPLSPFVSKLHMLLQDPKYFDVIQWTKDGRALVIPEMEAFKKHVLETDNDIFKTKNFTSFVRQLNLYGFRKIPVNCNKDPTINMHFEHPSFRRDRPDLMPLVHRTYVSNKKRSLQQNFQDFSTPKRLHLDGQTVFEEKSPFGSNSSVMLLSKHGSWSAVNMKLDSSGDRSHSEWSEEETSRDLTNSQTQQSQEHDYALPVYQDGIRVVGQLDERFTFDYLYRKFQDEQEVVRTLLNMRYMQPLGQSQCMNLGLNDYDKPLH